MQPDSMTGKPWKAFIVGSTTRSCEQLSSPLIYCIDLHRHVWTMGHNKMRLVKHRGAGLAHHLSSFTCCEKGKRTALLINQPMGKGHTAGHQQFLLILRFTRYVCNRLYVIVITENMSIWDTDLLADVGCILWSFYLTLDLGISSHSVSCLQTALPALPVLDVQRHHRRMRCRCSCSSSLRLCNPEGPIRNHSPSEPIKDYQSLHRCSMQHL